MLETKVAAFLERHSFLLENKKIVVGVSGGPDSLALLHYLWGQKEEKKLSIVAAHIDHMLRGDESFEDALFVKAFCKQYSIPFEMARIDVPLIMAQTKKSVEVAAREARYGFFAKVMEDYDYPFLALAHHGDDQIETILMRFTRGSTGRARAGIPFQRPFQNGSIFRPFLNLNKEEIRQYCEEHQLVPRIDPTNEENLYSRNRFRKAILPFLKSENKQVHEHFQRFSEEWQEDEAFLQELTVQRMNTIIIKNEKLKITIDIKKFLEMPIPLQRRGIQLILNYLYKEKPASLSAVHIDQVFTLIHRSHPSGRLDFPNSLHVIRSYQECLFQFELVNSQSYYFEISSPGTSTIPGFGIIKMEFTTSPIYVRNTNIALFNAEIVRFPLIVRTRAAGDRMSMKGMSGTKKLKDIFIDQKIAISERNTWPVVSDSENRILWLPGLKKSAIEGISDSAKCYIQLTYHRE